MMVFVMVTGQKQVIAVGGGRFGQNFLIGEGGEDVGGRIELRLKMGQVQKFTVCVQKWVIARNGVFTPFFRV